MTDATAASPRQRATLSAVAVLVLLEAALVVSWSAGFVGIRFAIDHAPIFLILLWRSLVSGVLLLPFALTLGPKLRLRQVLAQMLFGALAMPAISRALRWPLPMAFPPAWWR